MIDISKNIGTAYELIKHHSDLVCNSTLAGVKSCQYTPVIVRTTQEHCKKYNKPYTGDLLIQFTDDMGCVTSPWGLNSILYGSNWGSPVKDELFIDGGQRWLLTDLKPVLDELRKIYPKEGE